MQNNTPKGDDVVTRLQAAEQALKALDPSRFEGVEHWPEKELYGALYGHGGCASVPASYLTKIKAVMAMRVEMYRARKTGDIGAFRGLQFDSEVGNEQMAQTIEGALKFFGDGDLPDDEPHWNEFIPEVFSRHYPRP